MSRITTNMDKKMRRGSNPALMPKSKSAASRRTAQPIFTSTPSRTRKPRSPITMSRRKSSSSLPMDRNSMLVMEANEISELLGKDYVSMNNSDWLIKNFKTNDWSVIIIIIKATLLPFSVYIKV